MIGFSPHHERRGTAWSAGVLVLPLLLWLAGCGVAKPKTLPEQITGEWRNDDARYHGRFMRLETDEITFGLGGVGPDEGERVESVSTTPGDYHTDYTIRLRKADGRSDSLFLQFSEQNSGELRLKNQSKIIWKRKGEEAQTTPQKTSRPRASLREIAEPETLTPERIFGGHRTIYKIDCIRPKVCHSS
jgi:hypothetical protein